MLGVDCEDPKPEDVLFSAIQVKNLDLLFSNIVMTDTEADIDRRQRELIRNDVLMVMDNIACKSVMLRNCCLNITKTVIGIARAVA